MPVDEKECPVGYKPVMLEDGRIICVPDLSESKEKCVEIKGELYCKIEEEE